MITAAATAVIIGLLASIVPARAAARLNPTEALRA
jgi:ABC-type antimicrobial peptide transport system permease subunit